MEDNKPAAESGRRKACVPCKIIGLAIFALAGYGLYSLVTGYLIQ